MPPAPGERPNPLGELVDAFTTSLHWLHAGLGHAGGLCADLPAWPGRPPVTLADAYVVYAQALDLADFLAHARCPCHAGLRGRDALEAVERWRQLADHAISYCVLHSTGSAEDNRRRLERVAEQAEAFRDYVCYLAARPGQPTAHQPGSPQEPRPAAG